MMKTVLRGLGLLLQPKALHPDDALSELTRRELRPVDGVPGMYHNGAIQAAFASNFPQSRPERVLETAVLTSHDVGGHLEFCATATTLRWIRLAKGPIQTQNVPLPVEYQQILRVLRQASGRRQVPIDAA